MTPNEKNRQAREYMDTARQQEPAELRAILDWGRQQNAKRFKAVDGLVQFRADQPVRKV